jgi:hypothetical protein
VSERLKFEDLIRHRVNIPFGKHILHVLELKHGSNPNDIQRPPKTGNASPFWKTP